MGWHPRKRTHQGMNLLSNSSIKMSVKIQCKNIFWKKQFDNVLFLSRKPMILKRILSAMQQRPKLRLSMRKPMRKITATILQSRTSVMTIFACSCGILMWLFLPTSLGIIKPSLWITMTSKPVNYFFLKTLNKVNIYLKWLQIAFNLSVQF